MTGITKQSIHTHKKVTIEAFSDWVDDGEVVTGAAADQQIKRTPLVELRVKQEQGAGFSSVLCYLFISVPSVELLQMMTKDETNVNAVCKDVNMWRNNIRVPE